MKHFVTDCEAIYVEKWISNYGRCFKYGKGKGKVQPRTDHEGPRWQYRYSSTLSVTSTLDRGG